MALALARSARGIFARPAALHVAVRPYAAAADIAVADDTFTKWTNPIPQTYIHTPVLAGPPTKVRRLLFCNPQNTISWLKLIMQLRRDLITKI